MSKSSPLYKNIANKIKEEIINLNINNDEAIPSETKLAEKFDVSRVTVRQAIELLVKENILYKVQGSGTYVKTNKIEHHIYKLQSFYEEMKELNKKPFTKVIDFMVISPEENIASILKIDRNEKVFFIRRLRYADDELLVLEETYLPVKLFPDLTYEVMSKSKYDYIEKKGYKIKENFQEIIPTLPDEETKKLLELKKSIPILNINVWATLDNGSVFEYTKLYFRSDRYTFKLYTIRE